MKLPRKQTQLAADFVHVAEGGILAVSQLALWIWCCGAGLERQTQSPRHASYVIIQAHILYTTVGDKDWKNYMLADMGN